MSCKRWRGGCLSVGLWCVCLEQHDPHAGACICACGSSPPRPRCSDCTGDPCACGRDGAPYDAEAFLKAIRRMSRTAHRSRLAS